MDVKQRPIIRIYSRARKGLPRGCQTETVRMDCREVRLFQSLERGELTARARLIGQSDSGKDAGCQGRISQEFSPEHEYNVCDGTLACASVMRNPPPAIPGQSKTTTGCWRQ